MADEGSEAGSVAAPLPQEQITMLLNTQDFHDKVALDKVNLCCVLVTSTLCRQCGIRRIPYPKAPSHSAESNGGEDDDDGADERDDDEGREEGEEGDGEGGARTDSAGGNFYRDFETHLVRRAATSVQRRHVRFFHVCACAESETCIDFLIAADPAYRVLNKKPTPRDIAELHKTAHRQLHELLELLEVRSTPYLRFYLAGQPVCYSMMATADPAEAVAGATAANDLVAATGANRVKWARVLENAVVVRNAMMREYDAEARETARLARVEAKRLAREARKRQAAEEEEEEEEDDE